MVPESNPLSFPTPEPLGGRARHSVRCVYITRGERLLFQSLYNRFCESGFRRHVDAVVSFDLSASGVTMVTVLGETETLPWDAS